MNEFLRAEHITVCYNGIPVVRDVSFALREGEILGIVGESGSGKSTIIKAMAGLLGEAGMVTEGDVWYRGQNLAELSPKELRKLLGPEIGVVFQDCQAALCPIRTIGSQIHESLSEHEKISRKDAEKRALQVMEKVGLTDGRRVLGCYPFELSGGMNQRVGICTAMLQHPALLLADEPTSALDVTVQRQVVEELLLLRRMYHTAMVVVTHNIGVVRKMADQILVLKDGSVMDYGAAQEVLKHPQSAYTKELLHSVLELRRS